MSLDYEKDGRRHLGVLFGAFDDLCQHMIWNGIVEYAREHDIHLTAYFGVYQKSYFDASTHYETCLESIRNSQSLDGVIVLSAYVTLNMGDEKLKAYVARFPKGMPVVSVSTSLPGIPTVSVDSIAGMNSVVDHLIKVHGNKRIAFVKGPDEHWETFLRLEGYKKALAENGIAFDEDLVVSGAFSYDSGCDAVEEILDNRKLSVDAIVASNDRCAAGVIDTLKSRNITVPTDIAVTGFDDSNVSMRTTPSITTVRQDFFELGMLSASTLCDVIDDKPVEDVRYLTPTFIARQSCGCYRRCLASGYVDHEDASGEAGSLAAYALLKIKPLLAGAVPEDLIGKWVSELAESLTAEPFCEDDFVGLLYGILTECKDYSVNWDDWGEVVQALKMGVMRYRDEVACMESVLLGLLSALTLVSDTRFTHLHGHEHEVNEFRIYVSRAASNLILSFDTESLVEEMRKSLPRIHIDTAMICLYRENIKSDEYNADRSLNVVLGYDGERMYNIDYGELGKKAPLDFTLIDGCDFEQKRRALMFFPLFFRDEELGIVLLSYDERIPIDAYESLHIDISISVRGAGLVERIEEMSVIDDLTGLYNRRGFFNHAHAGLNRMAGDRGSGMPFVLFIDMDELKQINDTYGNNEGDLAIKEFSRVLCDALRGIDVVGRMGGDEFVAFSSVESKGDVKKLESGIHKKLAEYNDKTFHPFKLSASIGSAFLAAPTPHCLEDAILKADNALYEEKMKKRHSVLR